MRDAVVYSMHMANAKRDALILKQFEFLMTRQQAFEHVLFTQGLKGLMKLVRKPAEFKVLVDETQKELLRRSQALAEAAKKKPKITVVGANGHKT